MGNWRFWGITGPSSVGSSEPVTPVPIKGWVTEGSVDQTIPQVREVGS